MNIDKMPAGPEMNELVAKEIFGWRTANLRPGLWNPENHDPIHYSCDEPDEVPDYSTDIVAAWGIVETFRFGWQGHAAACIDIKISDWVTRPDCQVAIFAPDIAEARAEAYSPCLAICRAALRVVSNE